MLQNHRMVGLCQPFEHVTLSLKVCNLAWSQDGELISSHGYWAGFGVGGCCGMVAIL